MATWNLSPQYKKSAVEKMFFYKDGKVITVEQGFRWANFKVESDERPLTDEELKNEDGYELGCIDNDESWEMWDMNDGCWLDIEAGNDKTTAEDVEEFEVAWEEDSYCGVEELGWSNDDTEYYYYGPLELTNEDTGEVFKGEPDEEISVGGVPVTQDNWNPMTDGLEALVSAVSELEEQFGSADDPEVTEWYPASINPVREGSYEIMTSTEANAWPFPTMATWDGKKWSIEIAQWRGLTEGPNK
jgi:hypothetical protein